MNSFASSMDFERRKFASLSTYDFQRSAVNHTGRKEHDEYGETVFYPLSPLALTLYYAFDFEVETW